MVHPVHFAKRRIVGHRILVSKFLVPTSALLACDPVARIHLEELVRLYGRGGSSVEVFHNLSVSPERAFVLFRAATASASGGPATELPQAGKVASYQWMSDTQQRAAASRLRAAAEAAQTSAINAVVARGDWLSKLKVKYIPDVRRLAALLEAYKRMHPQDSYKAQAALDHLIKEQKRLGLSDDVLHATAQMRIKLSEALHETPAYASIEDVNADIELAVSELDVEGTTQADFARWARVWFPSYEVAMGYKPEHEVVEDAAPSVTARPSVTSRLL